MPWWVGSDGQELTLGMEASKRIPQRGQNLALLRSDARADGSH